MSLIGILIIIVGFALKLDTIAVVVSAGVVTGLVADMSISEILSTLGTAFINNRTTCLFMLTLPVIGLCERYGLKAKAIDLIKKAKGLSTGALLSGYTFIRESSIAMGVTLGGHPQFVRPLINPMAEGASIAKYGDLDEKEAKRQRIKEYLNILDLKEEEIVRLDNEVKTIDKENSEKKSTEEKENGR